MPVYEFSCGNCGHVFEMIMSLSEMQEAAVSCPRCQSSEVEQQLGSLAVKVGIGDYRGKIG